MKKLLVAVLFLFPTLAFAQTFDTNLSYGSTGSDVTALQEFLTDQKVYSGPISGNFYSLTLAAVKRFQTAESISPVSGFVGPITRATINTIIGSEASGSEGDAATSTEPVDLSQSTTTPYTPPQVIYVQVPAPIIPAPAIQQPIVPIVQIPRNPPTVTGSNVVSAPQIGIPGIHEVTFGSFTLSVAGGDENPTLTSIPMTLLLANGAKASDLGACQLFDGAGNLLNGGGMMIYGSGIQTSMDGGHGNTVPFTLHDRMSLPVNSSSTFTVVCWINTTAVSGASYAWSLDSNSSDWNVSGAQWADTIPVSIVGGQGTVVTTPSI